MFFTARGNPLEVSVRVGREMLLEVTKQEAVEMQRGSRAFVDGVRAVGVLHEVDGLVQLDQAVEQQLRAGVMHVVIAGAVDAAADFLAGPPQN